MSSGIDHANRPAPPRALYLAAPYSEKDRVSALATFLRTAASIPIASTWHALPTPEPTDIDEAELRCIAERNHRELRRADAAVFLIQRGIPRETYVELGAALEQGKGCLVFYDAAEHWTQRAISVYRNRVTMEAAPLEWHDTTTELAWLTDRIEAWYGAL